MTILREGGEKFQPEEFEQADEQPILEQTETETPQESAPQTESINPPSGVTESQAPITESSDFAVTAPTPVDINLEGASLIHVFMPDGTWRYFAEYQAYGVTLRFDIGDIYRLNELGLRAGDFESYQRIRRFRDFESREGLDVGSIDERLGVKETPQETIERELRIFGKEDIPPWMLASKEAMTVALQGAIEGWSDGRTLRELSQTGAFRQHFPDFDAFQSQNPDMTITQALNLYTQGRDQIRDSIRTWRGPGADLSDQFIGQVLAQGWDPDQVENLLIGEATLRQLGPGAVDRINEILAYQNPENPTVVGPENLLDFILPGETQRTPFELQSLINDAIRAQMFETQGITLSAELASQLGPDTEFSTLDPSVAAQIAAQTAQQIFLNSQELAAEREGLTREDLIRAMVDGTQSADVTAKLFKFQRRRDIESGGFTGGQAFLGDRGQLRIAGFNL